MFKDTVKLSLSEMLDPPIPKSLRFNWNVPPNRKPPASLSAVKGMIMSFLVAFKTSVPLARYVPAVVPAEIFPDLKLILG